VKNYSPPRFVILFFIVINLLYIIILYL